MPKFNERLKFLRREAGLSQQDFAKQLGMSKSSINMYERGEREPSIETLEAIADYFNVDMDFLFGKSEHRSKTAWLEGIDKPKDANPLKKLTTADRLKQIMAERGLRQVDILDACKPFCEKYGIKLEKNDLSQYISGKVQPRQDKLSILGMALDVNEVWLMGYNVPAEKDALCASEQPSKNETSVCALIEACHGNKNANQAVALFLQLDLFDQGKIIGKMEAMLESEKYFAKDESKHA